jgi:DNA-binding MarR family transcriptional regulator
VSVTRLARELRRQGDTGLSPSQISALTSIGRHGPVTLGRLATHEAVAPPSITRVVDKLVQRGLARRVPDPADRRVTRVSTTEAGELRAAPVTPRGRGQIRDGLRYIGREPELFVPLAMLAVIGTLSYNLPTVLPLFVTRDLDGSDAMFTVVYSVVSLGSLAGALVAARRADTGVRVVGLSALGFGVAMVALAVSPNVVITLGIGVLVGVASTTFIVSSTAIVQLRAVPEMRGRVLAIQSMLLLGSTPVGAPIVGWVAERYGARWSVALGAAAALLGGVWGLTAVRRRLTSRRVAGIGPPRADDEAMVA